MNPTLRDAISEVVDRLTARANRKQLEVEEQDALKKLEWALYKLSEGDEYGAARSLFSAGVRLGTLAAEPFRELALEHERAAHNRRTGLAQNTSRETKARALEKAKKMRAAGKNYDEVVGAIAQSPAFRLSREGGELRPLDMRTIKKWIAPAFPVDERPKRGRPRKNK